MAKLKKYNPKGSPPTGGRYSHIAKAEGKSVLFIAGQVALDRSGKVVGKGDVSAQTEQVLRNLQLALAAEGASLNDVAKINVYVTDVRFREEIQKVRAKYFPRNPPASTLIGVTALAQPDFLLEIEAIALIK